MEEIVQKFKDFLSHIAWSQNEADQLRSKIEAMPGARKQLFRRIDRRSFGEITQEDICDFCQDQGVPLSIQDQEILGKYFRAQNNPLDFNTFCMVLKPKNLSYWKPLQIDTQNPTLIFCRLVSCVLKAYHNLQQKRKQLSQSIHEIKSFFYENFDNGSTLTKDILQCFMRDEGIYNRGRYQHVVDYVFGECENQIPWNVLFNKLCVVKKETEKEGEVEGEWKGESPQVEKVSEVENEADLVETVPHFYGEKTETKIPTSQTKNSTEIDKVMFQIQEIEKALNEKKNKLKNKQQVLQVNENARSKVVGKLVSRKNPKQNTNSKQATKKFVAFDEEYEPKPTLNQSKYSRKGSENENSRSYVSRYIQDEDMDCYTDYRPLNHKKFSRNSSEAELKIQQIERRAMDKYLSKRNKDYQDRNVPYYYFHEYRGERNYTPKTEDLFHQTGMIRSASNSRLYATSPRNHETTRKLFNNPSQILRPMSPHYLRY